MSSQSESTQESISLFSENLNLDSIEFVTVAHVNLLLKKIESLEQGMKDILKKIDETSAVSFYNQKKLEQNHVNRVAGKN